MHSEGNYKIIKDVILAHLPDARVVLFGSRARGTEDRQSDYDLLVITARNFTQKERLSWSSSMHKSIVNVLDTPVDVLLFSEAEISEKKALPGHIVRTALKEGIVI